MWARHARRIARHRPVGAAASYPLALHDRSAGLHRDLHYCRHRRRPVARSMRHRQSRTGDVLRHRRLFLRLSDGRAGLSERRRLHRRRSDLDDDRAGRGLAGVAPDRLFPGARDARAQHHRQLAVLRMGLAHRRRTRHRRHPETRYLRLQARYARALLLPGLECRLRLHAAGGQPDRQPHRTDAARNARFRAKRPPASASICNGCEPAYSC